MQITENKKAPSRYKSGMWNETEQRYDATKRECRGVLKALKRFKAWVYGVSFVLEVDAKVLAAQLNRSGTDLPGALVTKWLAWIHLFDFKIRHVPDTKHTAADGLSRRPRSKSDDEDERFVQDIDAFIDADLDRIYVRPLAIEDDEDILNGYYSDHSLRIAQYLSDLQCPQDITVREFRAFKIDAHRYVIRDRHLFRRANKNIPIRRVIDSVSHRQQILKQLYNQEGHRGREETYRRVADRY